MSKDFARVAFDSIAIATLAFDLIVLSSNQSKVSDHLYKGFMRAKQNPVEPQTLPRQMVFAYRV